MSGLSKIFGVLHGIYGRPGAGVSVYSAPDSVLDFYRVSNVRMPLADKGKESGSSSRQTWIWGGGTAAHEAVLRTRCVGGKCA